MSGVDLGRRQLLKLAGCSALAAAPEQTTARRFLFTSRGKTGIMNVDGTGLRFLELDAPNQVSWQPGPLFRDGRTLILFSVEAGKAWEGNVRTRLWLFDLRTGSLKEIAEKQRLAPFYSPCLLLPGEERLLVQAVIDREGRLFSMDLDGTRQQEVTRAGQGFTYGVNLSPDGKRLAFHATGPRPHGYRIFTCNLDGSDRVLVAGHPDHLYFGVPWSPDGKSVLFQDCLFREDPGHDWSDLCVGDVGRSGHRVLTKGQSQWFAAAWGTPENHGSGSNVAQWTPDGRILYTRRLPGARTAFEFSRTRPDTDHFNRDYKPQEARGGTELCLLNPADGSVTQLTRNDPPQWDWGALCSPDGRQILFLRAKTGGYPAIWVMDAYGRNQRMLTRGVNGQGAFVSRWLPDPG